MSTSSPGPSAITVAMPAPAASSAAATLLSIPPRPSALPGPKTAERAAAPSSISGALAGAHPGTDVSSTSSRARTSTATCAASASLSPKLISSVAVASFSFTTGTAPSANSAPSALRTLTYARRSAISAPVRRICAASSSCGPSASCQARCSAAWPSADAACSRGRLDGRFSSPRRRRPSAIAPDETTHTGVPPSTISAISAARARSSVRRGRPRSSTTRLEPSLTTSGRFTGAAFRRRRRGTAAATGRDR